jgi:hypothetical protein
MNRFLLVPLLLFNLMSGVAAQADENLFGYSSSTDTLPQNAWELYQWVTYRTQKAGGTYQAIDYRTEIEYGWTNSLSQAIYFNFRQHKINGSAPLDETGNPEYPDLLTGVRFQGVQSAFKYNVLSAYKDPIGLSFYLEPGFSQIFKITGQEQEEYSLEVKALLQKNFMENLMSVVVNFNLEHEVRRFKGNDLWEKELAAEATGGISYRFIPNWFGGLETRYHSEYPEYGKREHWALFLGPTVHYGAKAWWFTATILPQFKGGPREDGQTGHLSEHEKIEYRLKLGYNF